VFADVLALPLTAVTVLTAVPIVVEAAMFKAAPTVMVGDTFPIVIVLSCVIEFEPSEEFNLIV